MGKDVTQKEFGWATFSIPDAKKLKAEKMLMGALLREPFNVSQHVGRLGRVALSNAGEGLGVAFLEILDQFAQYGNYSPLTVEQKTGINVSWFAANDTEIDLEWAIEIWWHEYSIWAEATSLQHGVSESAAEGGALAMRAAVEAARQKFGCNGSVQEVSPVDEFLEWGVDKIEGRERAFKTTPHFSSLRGIVKAFEPGELWIIGARPSMGKTQAALNLLSHFNDSGAKGLFVSQEMSGAALLRRLLGIRHGINPASDWGELDKAFVGRSLTETAAIEKNVRIVNGLYNISEIEGAAISAHYKGELDFLILDYLQMTSARGKQQNREREIASISEALKRLAVRLKMPVIALSQLSRDVEKRGGSKRPQMSDLRDTGSLEQDADGIIFLYRPEYYKIMEDEKGQSLKDVGEWIVAKQRNGDTDTARAKFSPIRGFSDLIPESKFPASAPTDFTQPKSEQFVIQRPTIEQLEKEPPF